MSSKEPSPGPDIHETIKLYSAIFVGNLLVWYDIAVYAFFAAYLAKNFFSEVAGTAAILYAYGTFAIAYLIRPIGALVLGAYADNTGRKQSMLLSIALLFFATFVIAVLPSYESIGIFAPIGLLLARLCQGFAAGGEFGSVTALLAERSEKRKGLSASLQMASQMVSGILAAALGLALTATLDRQELEDWGWRIPFFVGLLIGPVGLYLRIKLPEQPQPLPAKPKLPPTKLLVSAKFRMTIGMFVIVLSSAISYGMAYFPIYASQGLGLTPQSGYLAALLAFAIQAVIAPVSGHLSDQFGRLPIMITCAVIIQATCVPVFLWLIASPSTEGLVAASLWLAVIKAIYMGPMPALLTELFPREMRATGVALCYNIAVILFGATAPFFIAALSTVTDSKLEIAIYLTAAATLSVLALLASSKINRHLD